MNFVADRRRPVAATRFANDRLTLPWHPLQDGHSRIALIVAWLAMSAVLLFAAYPELGRIQSGSWSTPTPFALPKDALLMVGLPLLQLLVSLALVRETLRCLDFAGAAANLGLAIVPLLPLAVASFTPMRVDEAGWQALCGLFTLRMLVDRRRAAAKAGLAGASSAIMAALSPDGIWLAGAAVAFLSFDFLRSGRGPALAVFCFGFAIGTAAYISAATPIQHWSEIISGRPGWPSVLAWGASGLIAGALCCRTRAPAMLARIIALVAVVATAASILIASEALPLMALPGWHETLPASYLSGRKVAHSPQWHDAAGMVAATMILWLAAVVLRRDEFARSANPRGWLAVVMLSGTMAFLALFSPRAALLAQVLAIPLFALMLRDALRVASRFASAPGRVAAISLALFALTPTGGAVAGTLAASLADGRPLGWPAPIEQATAGFGTILPID